MHNIPLMISRSKCLAHSKVLLKRSVLLKKRRKPFQSWMRKMNELNFYWLLIPSKRSSLIFSVLVNLRGFKHLLIFAKIRALQRMADWGWACLVFKDNSATNAYGRLYICQTRRMVYKELPRQLSKLGRLPRALLRYAPLSACRMILTQSLGWPNGTPEKKVKWWVNNE